MKTVFLLRCLLCVALLMMFCAPFAHAQNSYQFVRAVGSANADTFGRPQGIAVDTSGNVYVADPDKNRALKFDSNGDFLLGVGAGYNGVAGSVGTAGSGAGQFYNPQGVAVDGNGSLYVADNNNHRIQKFDSNGNFLFQIGTFGSQNGQFNHPIGVTTDLSGNIYVADGNNNRVQEFSSSGNYLTQFGLYGTGNGQFNIPADVAVGGNGSVYVVDYLNNRVQVFAPIGPPIYVTLALSGLAPNAAPQFITFTFRPNDGSAAIVRAVYVPANSSIKLDGLVNKAGVLHIKADKFLAVDVPVDFSNGNVSIVLTNLVGGDANNDNVIDIADFGALVNTYNDAYNVNDPNADPADVAADFNWDGVIDIGDFGILVNNYNASGAN